MTIWILIAAVLAIAVLMRPTGVVTVNTGVTTRGLNGAFFPAFQEAPVLWRDICSLINSDGRQEDYKWLGQVPMPVEWSGPRRTQALRDYGQSLVNKHWEATLEIDRDEFADDQTGQLDIRARDMGRRFAMHPDKIVTDLIVAGESTLCYDGQYFFDTDHLEGSSGTQSNSIQVDIATTTAPTDAEFATAVWAAVKQLAGFKDDQGEPWNLFTDISSFAGLMFLVPPQFMDVAMRVLGQTAATIIGNTTNILAGKGRVFTNVRLSWTTKFAVLKIDDPMRPFIFQQRQAIQTSVKDDIEFKPIKYLADARYAVGYGLWQKGVLVTFV